MNMNFHILRILHTPNLFDHLPTDAEVDFLQCNIIHPNIEVELYSEILYWINKIDLCHYQFISLKKNKNGWVTKMDMIHVSEIDSAIKQYRYITNEALNRYNQFL